MACTHVYMRHVRQMTLCSRGTRAWAASHSLDYTKFLQEGIPITTLEKIGDDWCLKAIQLARDEYEQQQGESNG